MSDPSPRLPAHPSLEQLRKQAKDLLRGIRNGLTESLSRLRRISPNFGTKQFSLADAQFVVAREYGFEKWADLAHHIETVLATGRMEHYEKIAMDLVASYYGDAEALKRLNSTIPGRTTTVEQIREMVNASEFNLDLARQFLASKLGFENWTKLAESCSQRGSDPRLTPHGISAAPPFYKINWKENAIYAGPLMLDRDWLTLFEVMKEHGITTLNAQGQMTDRALEQLAAFECVRALNFDGTKKLSDDGLRHLARMPQLEALDLSDYPGGVITDKGLQSIRHLLNLRRFQMAWQRGITDAGIANLAGCESLEDVSLIGSPTGDGALRSLSGKPHLHHLKTGRFVTDAGLPLLHEFPIFKKWQGVEATFGLMSFASEPNHLLLDGPFSDSGLASLAGLDGLAGLTFFWHVSAMTPDGLSSLAHLPNLVFLGCQDELCNDAAMKHIAAIPGLRMLMGQGSVASDAGWTDLSKSQTLEYIWGRECPNLGSRAFVSLSQMPALRGLAVSCKNVDDSALSALPEFRSLTGLLPMDVTDDGFRHVGNCQNLENLWCMYCRDTGDEATEHISRLSRLRTYYAGSTQISDRSLDILSKMSSLEEIELSDCKKITNAGVGLLARLPNLRVISVDGCPKVTREAMTTFSGNIRANYS